MPHEERLGRVRLVGAGPGSADLLTVRALRAIEGARAILYDALVSPEILALAPGHCLKIQTGKRAGRASMRQEVINRLMLRLARRGLDVVRLKGGDPGVFGRVGEELAFLRAHGVEADVVPGVTAACAAAAQFGFPLTERGAARRLVLATARLAGGDEATDWAAADPEATLAVYMGRDTAPALAARLLAMGRCARTPAAIIEHAGDPRARVLFAGALGDLATAAPADACGPALIIVGSVVRDLAADAATGAEQPQARAAG
jgi:uroporphyrin-III C-methyltransferase